MKRFRRRTESCDESDDAATHNTGTSATRKPVGRGFLTFDATADVSVGGSGHGLARAPPLNMRADTLPMKASSTAICDVLSSPLLQAQKSTPAVAALSGVDEDGDDSEDSASFAASAAAARAHRQHARQRAAFVTVAGPASRMRAVLASGVAPQAAISASGAAAVTLDADDDDPYTGEDVAHPGVAADLASIRAAVRSGVGSLRRAPPAIVSTETLASPVSVRRANRNLASRGPPSIVAGWEDEQLERAMGGSSAAAAVMSMAADRALASAASKAVAAAEAQQPPLDALQPPAEIGLETHCAQAALAAARLREAAATDLSASNVAEEDSAVAEAERAAVAARLAAAAAAYDFYTSLRKRVAATVTMLRARAPMVEMLIAASMDVATLCVTSRRERRAADLRDAVALAAADGRLVWAPPPLMLTSATAGTADDDMVAVSPTELLSSLAPPCSASAVAAALRRLSLASRAALRSERLARVTARLDTLLTDTCSGRVATFDAAALDLWDAADAPSAAEALLPAAALRPLAEAHELAQSGETRGVLETTLEAFATWRAGGSGRCLSNGSTSSAPIAGVAGSYARSFAYASLESLCAPMVLLGSWPWLVQQPLSLQSAATRLQLSALPWFASLWTYGEGSASSSAADDGKPASGGSEGKLVIPDNSERAAAATSDEMLLPRLVATTLVPAAARLLPHSCDALSAASNALQRDDIVAELCLFDLPPASVETLAAAAERALVAAADVLAVPVILAQPEGGVHGGWIDAAAPMLPATETLLMALGALRLLNSAIQWRDVVSDAFLRRFALARVLAGTSGLLAPLLEHTLTHARAVHLGGTLLASALALLPSAWLFPAAAGASTAPDADADAANLRLRGWVRAALLAEDTSGAWQPALRAAVAAWESS